MVLILAFMAVAIVGVVLLRTRAAESDPASGTISRAAVALCGIVAIPSIAQFVFPGLLLALRRDADLILHHGQWWRLVTSLVVQDGGVAGTVFNLVWLVGLAALGAALLGDRNLLLLFGVGGLAGEIAGLSWQPIGGGNSVGNLGIGGGILAFALLRATDLPPRILAGIGAALGIVLAAQRNIHGAALLAGIVVGFILFRPSATR